MANPLGRISGQLLKDNLTRNGHELSFDTDLLFLNTSPADPLLHTIGVNSTVPFRPLMVEGTLLTEDLISSGLSAPQITISGNQILSVANMHLVAATQVNVNNLQTANLDINNNIISSRLSNSPIELSPSGAGTVDIYSNVNINNNHSLYATGDITIGGSIIIGDSNTDTIIFNADVDSDIVPDLDNWYSLGSDPAVIGNKRWLGLYPALINGSAVTAGSIGSGGVNLVLRPGNTWFVAKAGNDTNVGDHENGAFLTIEHALSVAQSGDTIVVYPGTYTEITPLTIPTGVALKGISLRSVTLVPDVTTQYNNIFLLNGQTTVDNITIADFYYDSILDTGYAFSFAPGFKVTSRSPYIQNITVITKGTVITADDPRGFASGDAGKGALVDGSVVDTSTNEATLLFNSVTFITPGVNALTMTNGVRIEWLNSFVYFANIGLYATTGVGRYDSNLAETRYGAEIRCMGSANVYGNYGAWAEGLDTLMYLVNHNFAYIGAGKDSLNDPSLNIAANETVEIDTGRIYYQSIDNKGNFQVGDSFKVSYETGDVSFNGLSVTAGGVSSIAFSTPSSETILNATLVSTGNIQFSGHKLTSLYGPVNLTAATNEIAVPHDVFAEKDINITGDFNIDGKLTLGNQTIDVVEFLADIEFDLRPVTTNTYNLGSATKKWINVNAVEADVGTSLRISGHTIETLVSGTDLTLTPNGLGKVIVPSNNTEIENDLTVSTGTTSLKALTVGSVGNLKTIDLTGNYNQTGNTLRTGDTDLTGHIQVSSNAKFSDVQFINNRITTTSLSNDLELLASGIGEIYVPTDNVQIVNNLYVDDTTTTGTMIVTTTVTADQFSTGDILIENNRITTTIGNNNLILAAAGTGGILAEKVLFNNNTISAQTTNSNLTISPTATYSVLLSTNTALKVPVGTTANRPTLIQGDFRFNTSETSYKGFSTAKVSFGGIYSADRLTRATAHPTNNTIEFYTSGVSAMDVLTDKLRMNQLLVDNKLSVNSNIISNTLANDDLIIAANGTGSVKLNSLGFFQDQVTNLDPINPLVISHTRYGYLKIGGTGAITIPYGDSTPPTYTPEIGDLRYNTEIEGAEVFSGLTYISISGPGAGLATAAQVNELTNLMSLIFG